VTTDNYNELQLIYLFCRYLSRRFIESARWKRTDSDEEEEKCKNSAKTLCFTACLRQIYF
jgi:hypothetical protein